MRRSKNSGVSGDVDTNGGYDTDALLCRRAPTLHQFLSDTQWDDGGARVPGTLLLFCEQGRYKACLNDRDGSRSVFVSGDSVEAILDALEAGLADDDLEWRAKPAQQSKGRK